MIRRDDEKVDWLKCIGNTKGTGRKHQCLLGGRTRFYRTNLL